MQQKMKEMNFSSRIAVARIELILDLVRVRPRSYPYLANKLGVGQRLIRRYVNHLRETNRLRVADWYYGKGFGSTSEWRPLFGLWQIGGDKPKPLPKDNSTRVRTYRERARRTPFDRPGYHQAVKRGAERTRRHDRIAVLKNVNDPLLRSAIHNGMVSIRTVITRVTPDMKQKIVDLRHQGRTYSEIGMELGISRDAASYHYRKMTGQLGAEDEQTSGHGSADQA